MKWLWFGIIGVLISGLWGLFDKLSGFQNPFASNLILYSTAILSGFLLFVLFSKKLRFSKYSLLAGLFAGVGNFFLIYSLVKNYLILVLPFVSMASVAFFLMILFIEKPKYNRGQKILISIGIILNFIGMFLVAIGSVGISEFIKQFTFNWTYLLQVVMVLLGFTFWTFFTYKSASKEKIDAVTYNFWNVAASFFVAIIVTLIFSPSMFSGVFSLSFKGYLYPAIAGLAVVGGCFFTYKAYKATTNKTKLQEAIIAILSNGELIPLLFLSYFILHEWVWEGFIGTIIVLIGLCVLHFAEGLGKK
ncbi:MAG: hypothetical protein NTX24_02970 [Candidatus Pacearchaeota archaeon]|nr:hypothetical protein [Candidatus Pacearchaeota archaeon]